MGCLFQCLDPNPPDESVRHFWHIRGVIIDAAVPSSSASSSTRQHHSPSTDTLQVDALSNGQQQRRKQRNANNNNNKNGDATKRPSMLSVRDRIQHLPAGVLYVYEGRLIYRGRRWAPRWCIWRREPDELEVELCEIGDVNVVERFISQRDNKPVRGVGPLVDVLVLPRPPGSARSPRPSSSLHLGILTENADIIGKELRETFHRHRQRPRIFQFNSVDIEGVEIDVP